MSRYLNNSDLQMVKYGERVVQKSDLLNQLLQGAKALGAPTALAVPARAPRKKREHSAEKRAVGKTQVQTAVPKGTALPLTHRAATAPAKAIRLPVAERGPAAPKGKAGPLPQGPPVAPAENAPLPVVARRPAAQKGKARPKPRPPSMLQPVEPLMDAQCPGVASRPAAAKVKAMPLAQRPAATLAQRVLCRLAVPRRPAHRG